MEIFMKKIDLIVKAPHFYTMEGSGVGYRADASMAVDRGRIVAVDEQEQIEAEYQAEETICLEHHMVLPGFIDAHMHTSCAVLRGLAQDTNNWMMYGLQPFQNAVTQKEKDAGSRLALLEAVRNGTTTLGDYEGDMTEVCRFIEKIGARGNITQTIRSAKQRVYNPGELYEFDQELGEKSLEQNLKLYDDWHEKAGGRIRILFGPQGADFMDEALLKRIQTIAKERKTKIHMHTQQGDRETYQVVKRYGMRPVDWLQKIGYLDDTLIAVHLTDCTEEEAAQVAKSGASMIVCPGSIAIIDGIVPPSVAFRKAGGSCALGSDQAPGNNCHNIINEMKLVTLLNKIRYQDPEVMPAWEALRMATVEGARSIGLGEEIGSLEAGKKADFIAVDLSKPTMLPVYTKPMRNMVPNLVYSARGEEVCLVAVDGKIICRDGKMQTVDERECFEEVSQCPEEIGRRATAEFQMINGTNAQFMSKDQL